MVTLIQEYNDLDKVLNSLSSPSLNAVTDTVDCETDHGGPCCTSDCTDCTDCSSDCGDYCTDCTDTLEAPDFDIDEIGSDYVEIYIVPVTPESPAKYYQIFVRLDDSSEEQVYQRWVSSGGSRTITGLEPNTDYAINVAACRTSGSGGTWAGTQYFTTLREQGTKTFIYSNGWKEATPYIYNNGSWKKATPHIYDDDEWK